MHKVNCSGRLFYFQFSKHDKKVRISPRHIKLAVLNDAEISGLLSSVIIAAGGVLPDNIQPSLLPKKNLSSATLKSPLKGVVLSPAF